MPKQQRIGTIEIKAPTLKHGARLNVLAKRHKDGAYSNSEENGYFRVVSNAILEDVNVECLNLVELRIIVDDAIKKGYCFSYHPGIRVSDELAKYADKNGMLTGVKVCWALDACGQGLSCLVLKPGLPQPIFETPDDDPIFSE